jgi:hypothetical protein
MDKKLGILLLCLGFIGTPLAAAEDPFTLPKSVFYNFDNLSQGGFAIDGEGDWHKGGLYSNADPANIKAGKGSLEARISLKPGQSVRLSKGFQTADLSVFKAMRFQVKASKAGLKVNFFTMTNGWKWSQLPESELKPGEWLEIKAPFSGLAGSVPSKMNALGLFFSAKDGYDGSVFVDEIEYHAEGVYAREKARASSSGFEAVSSTVAVEVAVDGSKAYGVGKKGLIAFNIGDSIEGNTFISDKLKEAGPGIMRMWSFGGYHSQMNFNPAEGQYDWEYLDKEVKHLVSIGWEPMFCLGEPQKWNTDPKRYMPKDFKKWAVMAAEIVRHYNMDLKLGLHTWEVWNEHDIGFWGGTEEEYLQLLDIASAAMKKADPSIRIFAGAWANPGMVKKVGGAMLDKVPPKGHYDGISWHNYLVSSFIPEAKIMDLTPLMEAPAYNAWKHLSQRGLDSTMEVGMSEANINPSADTDWRQEGMLGAVYWASALYHYIVQNSSLAVYFTANGDDNYGTLSDRAKPAFQSALLYSKYAKVVGKQWLQTSYPATLATLETLAMASDTDLTLIGVNKDTQGTAYAATYSLAQLPELKGLHAWGLSDGHLEVTDLGPVKIKDNKIQYTFKPFSVTILTGAFKTPRTLAPLLKAEPSAAAMGLAVMGQYSFSGKPALIAKAQGPVKWGADLKAFASAPATRFDGTDPARVIGTKLKAPTDLVAELRMLRDDKNLYVGVEVTQGRGPVNSKEMNQLWNADSIELSLSGKSDLAFKSRLKKSDWDYQICMAPTSGAGKPAITCFNATFKGMQVQAKATKTGYKIAASIPLSNFEEQDWAPGKKIRFDIAVAKAGKDGNRESKLYWNATSDAWDSPDEWGLAEFK